MDREEERLALAGVPPPARPALRRYLELLARWNERVNLTAARDDDERVAILVEPALALLPLLLPGALLDVGSGNGAPGLVLALLDPGRPVTLLEPRARRWAFLREAARACGRPDVDVRRERHEHFRGAPVANLTARALRLTAPALERLLAPGGRALLSGAVPGAEPLELPGRGGRIYVYGRGAVSRET